MCAALLCGAHSMSKDHGLAAAARSCCSAMVSSSRHLNRSRRSIASSNRIMTRSCSLPPPSQLERVRMHMRDGGLESSRDKLKRPPPRAPRASPGLAPLQRQQPLTPSCSQLQVAAFAIAASAGAGMARNEGQPSACVRSSPLMRLDRCRSGRRGSGSGSQSASMIGHMHGTRARLGLASST